MIRPPKGRLLLLALTGVVLAGALVWSLRPRPAGCATPLECLQAYREASRAGDPARYLRYLGEPLRSQVQQSYPDDGALAESLQRDTRPIKAWVDIGPLEEQGDRALANVEEVRETGQRRLRFHLERTPDGWLIVRIEKDREQTPAVPYGTPVGEEPGSR